MNYGIKINMMMNIIWTTLCKVSQIDETDFHKFNLKLGLSFSIYANDYGCTIFLYNSRSVLLPNYTVMFVLVILCNKTCLKRLWL